MANIRADRDAFNIASIHASHVTVQTGDHSNSGSAGASNRVRRDVFRPSFYTPPNPREVLLDFGLELDSTQRHTPEAKVLHEILREDASDETRIISIHGKAGVGKSCILRGLGDQRLLPKLKKRFPGGIYFSSLGMDATESTLIQRLAEITRMCGGEELGNELRGEDNLRIVVKKVREWMGGEKCLLLMDDFWKRNGLGESKVREVGQMFNEESGSVLVMTTRFMDLARLGVGVEVEERETMSKEAEAILLRHAEFEREEIEDKEEVDAFYKVLKMCGGLPLFLSVAGRGVAHLSQVLKAKVSKRKSVWVQYWRKLKALGHDEFFDTRDDEYPNLNKTLRLSLELLSERRGERAELLSVSKLSFQEMHRALSVFKKQERIPISACRRLWNAKSIEAALQIGEWFAGVGLADFDSRRSEKNVVCIRLHDLVHMFAMKCATDKGEIAKWHGQLLEGYAPKGRGSKGVRKWWEICKEACNDDGGDEYLFENVCRHLMSSGNVKELVGLLVSGEWSKVRHEVGGLSAWKGDFWECLEGLKKVGGSEIDAETEGGLGMVRDAVVESWAAVHENVGELGYQVFGRLIDCENEVVRRYLRSIEEVQSRPWMRPVQRCWERPGKGMLIGEFDLGDIVRNIAFHKKSFTAVVGVGKEVAIIDLKEMRVLRRCAGHTRIVCIVGISDDGKRAFSWSRDRTVRQWNVETGEEHKDKRIRTDGRESGEEIDENDWTWCAAFSPGNGFFVTGSERGRIKIWDLCRGTRVGRTIDTSERAICIAMSPNGRIVAAGLDNRSVALYDVDTCRLLCEELEGHEGEIEDIVFRTDGRVVASCGRDSTIRLWDVESKTQLGDPFESPDSPFFSVAFSEDGKQICSAVVQGLSVRDVPSGAEIRSWKAHTSGAYCVALIGHAGNRLAVSGSNDGTVRVWDLQATPDEREARIYHKFPISCVVASPDGRFFVAGSGDGTLRIWDGLDGRPVREALCGHEGWVTSVAVSPDGRWVVSGSRDCTLRVWDLRTCTQVGDALQGHKGWVNSVAYSPNGEFVISGSRDRTVRVWRVMDYCESGGSSRNPGISALTWQSRLKRFLCCKQHVGEVASNFERVAGPEADKELWNREALRLEKTLRPEVADGDRANGRKMGSVTVSRDGQRVLAGTEDGEIYVWDMNSGRRIDRKQSRNYREIERIEISEDNEVVPMSCFDNELRWRLDSFDKELRWRLDNEGRLIDVLQSEEGIAIGQTKSQGGFLSRVFGAVLCHGRTVELCSSGQKIATLSEEVSSAKLWTYNTKSKMLCISCRDERVLFFQVVF